MVLTLPPPPPRARESAEFFSFPPTSGVFGLFRCSCVVGVRKEQLVLMRLLPVPVSSLVKRLPASLARFHRVAANFVIELQEII